MKYIMLFIILLYLGASIGFYLDALRVSELYNMKSRFLIMPALTFLITIGYIFFPTKNNKIGFFKRCIILFVPHKQYIVGLVFAESTKQETHSTKPIRINISALIGSLSTIRKKTILQIRELFTIENANQLNILNSRLKKT